MIIAIALSLAAVIVAFATRRNVLTIAERIQAAADRINASIGTLKTLVTSEGEQHRAEMQKLRDAIASNDPAAIEAALTALETSSAAIEAAVADVETIVVPANEAEGTGTEL